MSIKWGDIVRVKSGHFFGFKGRVTQVFQGYVIITRKDGQTVQVKEADCEVVRDD